MKTLLAGTTIDLGGKVTVYEANGLVPEQFGPHSFRSGGATGLFGWGVPVQFIKLLGRWSPNSKTLERFYVKPRQQAVANWMQWFIPDEGIGMTGFALSPAFASMQRMFESSGSGGKWG